MNKVKLLFVLVFVSLIGSAQSRREDEEDINVDKDFKSAYDLFEQKTMKSVLFDFKTWGDEFIFEPTLIRVLVFESFDDWLLTINIPLYSGIFFFVKRGRKKSDVLKIKSLNIPFADVETWACCDSTLPDRTSGIFCTKLEIFFTTPVSDWSSALSEYCVFCSAVSAYKNTGVQATSTYKKIWIC